MSDRRRARGRRRRDRRRKRERTVRRNRVIELLPADGWLRYRLRIQHTSTRRLLRRLERAA